MNIIEFADYIESKPIAWIRRRMKHIWKVVNKILHKALKSNSPTLDRLDIIKDREQRRTNVWCPQECPDLTWHFLAATTSSSVNRFIPSVLPSVRLTITPFFFAMFPSSYHHKIFKFKFKRRLLTHNTWYSNLNNRPPCVIQNQRNRRT